MQTKKDKNLNVSKLDVYKEKNKNLLEIIILKI